MIAAQCSNCHAGADVPGGLCLTDTLDTWVCRRGMACIVRERAQQHPDPEPLACPHCESPTAELLIDPTDHWACPCGGHGHTSQLVPEGKP